MTDRKYLPTTADLIDRLSIVLMKSIFIPEYRAEYRKEIELIKHDIQSDNIDAKFVYAVLVLMLANRAIWENESEARRAGPAIESHLRLTHSLNGVRNRAKNIIASSNGERVDLKVDCLATDLPLGFGDWNVFE
jgi:hypothetical protein